jgi:serine/threonine protein kinase
MPLALGTKLGPYELIAPVGAGGMGEVYRARDMKLGREVALKVLPEAFARETQRMARFQREAKVLASLHHPNIAAIYGVEDSGRTPALVMELVEGPTLGDRIRQGPIPIEDALRIAKQICDALEYAHEHGIVHRDLKPANVKVTSDDAVKVLDFGLAKAMEDDAASLDISTSPTLSRGRRFDWPRALDYLEKINSTALVRRFGWPVDHVKADLLADIRERLLRRAAQGPKTWMGPNPSVKVRGAVGYDKKWRLFVNVPREELRESAGAELF